MTEEDSKKTGEPSPEVTELEKKIIRQIEYYFGNANLRQDRFLQLQLREDDGWVPLKTIVNFKRLKNLSTDHEVLVTALSKSTSGLMEIHDSKEKIRRSPKQPLPPSVENAEYMLNLKARTVYCKGFSLDSKIDEIQPFMDQFGETEAIYMRRDKEKVFKGSVFATYKTKADAQKFIDQESLKFGDEETVRYFKSDYYKALKVEEKNAHKDKSEQAKQKRQQQREQKKIELAKTEYKGFNKGHLLHFTGASDQTTREDLRVVFEDYGAITWVDFHRDNTEGVIRFQKGNMAQDILDRVLGDYNDKLEIRGNALTMKVLEGEEEEEHWKEVFEQLARRRMKRQEGSRKKRRGGERQDSRNTRFEGKKTKFDDSDEDGKGKGGEKEDGEGIVVKGKAEGDEKEAVEVDIKEEGSEKDSGTKRPLEEAVSTDEPATKQVKTESTD